MDKENNQEIHKEELNLSSCFFWVFPRKMFGVLRCEPLNEEKNHKHLKDFFFFPVQVQFQVWLCP